MVVYIKCALCRLSALARLIYIDNDLFMFAVLLAFQISSLIKTAIYFLVGTHLLTSSANAD